LLLVRDQVYVSSQNLVTDRPCRKLREKFLSPFKILECIGIKAYKLELPTSMKVHPVFPVGNLKPAAANRLSSQPKFTRPKSVVIQGSDEYEVEAILNSRRNRFSRIEYLVRWVGYPNAT
jgi:hypothetical protein